MLSLGTIVYLHEGHQKLVIISGGALVPSEEIEGKPKLYDYSACFYPQGMNTDQVFYFNDENVEKVVFEGFRDEEEERFTELYNEWCKNHSDDFIKGIVAN